MASFAVRDPIVFAYQWASLDQISGGRMLLAACTGIVSPNQASAREGSHWAVADRERATRLEENIEVCRRLWLEDGVHHSGAYRSFEDVTIEPKPIQRPCPIWIAGNPVRGRFYDRALQRVARLADGWMSNERTPQGFAATWADLQKHLKDYGRDPGTFPPLPITTSTSDRIGTVRGTKASASSPNTTARSSTVPLSRPGLLPGHPRSAPTCWPTCTPKEPAISRYGSPAGTSLPSTNGWSTRSSRPCGLVSAATEAARR